MLNLNHALAAYRHCWGAAMAQVSDRSTLPQARVH